MPKPAIVIEPLHSIYDGPLGRLKEHQHSVICILIGLERSFSLSSPDGTTEPRFALVPANVKHRLDFFGARTLVVYVEPHDPLYAGLHKSATNRCVSTRRLSESMTVGVRAWNETRDLAPLLNATCQSLQPRNAELDERITRLVAAFNRGELLNAKAEEMARYVALSPSRLLHLFKSELGVGIRRLKQHYRFKRALTTLAQGGSLTKAAHDAGFSDSAHLSRLFSETFGLNPMKVFGEGIEWLIRE